MAKRRTPAQIRATGLLQFSGFVIGRIAAVKRASRPQAQLVPPFPFRLATETAAVLIKRMRAQLTEKVGAFHFFDCHAWIITLAGMLKSTLSLVNGGGYAVGQ